MFIRLFYSIVIKIDNEYKHVESSSRERSATSATTGGGTNTTITDTPNPYTPNPDMNVHFEETKMKLKSFYFLNEDKILDIIEFIIMNIHPDPEKRLLPEEAKNMFNAILNNC
jgi:hypothetical protein